MKIFKKVNAIIFLILLILIGAIFYSLYIIIYYPIEFKLFYFTTIFILTLFLIYFLYCLKYNDETKKNINLIVISTIITIYVSEILLHIYSGCAIAGTAGTIISITKCKRSCKSFIWILICMKFPINICFYGFMYRNIFK